MSNWKTETRWLATYLADNGYSVLIDWGDELAYERPSNDATFIIEHAHQTDCEDWIIFKGGERVGWLWLIPGNGPGELIADHTDNDEMEAIYNALSRRFPG